MRNTPLLLEPVVAIPSFFVSTDVPPDAGSDTGTNSDADAQPDASTNSGTDAYTHGHIYFCYDRRGGRRRGTAHHGSCLLVLA